MFLKTFDYSVEMQKMRRKFNNKMIEYGLKGEERVAYQLSKMDFELICLYNVRIKVENKRAQFDFLVITRKAIIIIEVKNLLGNLYISKDEKFERNIKINGRTDISSMENPFIQMDNQEEILKIFMKEKHINKDVKSILVMANDKMIIRNNSKRKTIIKYDVLCKYLKELTNHETYTNEELIIGNIIKEHDDEYNYFMLGIIKDNIEKQYIPKFTNYLDFDLYLQIIRFRKEFAIKKQMPVCNVFTNREAERLVIAKPKTKEEFIAIRGFKEKRYELFGEEIIKIFKNNP